MDQFRRKDPITIEKAVGEFIREMKLVSGFNNRRVFSAWDEVSGAAAYTSDRFYRDGTLYITLTSSVVRSNLYFQQDALIRAINDHLAADPFFIKDDPNCRMVTKLVLK